MAIGFVSPGDVLTVNGKVPVGGNIALDASDIPFDNTTALTDSTDVQGALTYTATHDADYVYYRRKEDLPPAVGGVHTITDPRGLPRGSIVLDPGNRIEFDLTGAATSDLSMHGFSTNDTRIVADVAGPAVTINTGAATNISTVELSQFAIANLNAAGSGLVINGELVGGTTPTLILTLRNVSISAAVAGSISNVLSGQLLVVATAASDGLSFPGVYGPMRIINGAHLSDAPAVGARWISIEGTAVISSEFIVHETDFSNLDAGPGDVRGIYIDPAATILEPSGVRIIDCTGAPTAVGYLDPAGLGADSDRVQVLGGTPDAPSTVYGGALFTDLVDYISVPIVLEDTAVLIPGRSIGGTELSPTTFAEGLLLTVDTAPATGWRVTATGAETVRVAVSTTLTVTRAGAGGDFTTQAYLAVNGVEVPGSRRSLLCQATPLTYDFDELVIELASGDELAVYALNPIGQGTNDPRVFQLEMIAKQL